MEQSWEDKTYNVRTDLAAQDGLLGKHDDLFLVDDEEVFRNSVPRKSKPINSFSQKLRGKSQAPGGCNCLLREGGNINIFFCDHYLNPSTSLAYST